MLIDEDGIYEPRSPNDRLLLGMKGTISEMELSTFRQRSMEALRAKARRGELLTTVAIGYVRSTDDRIEIDPDQRIRAAIGSVFAKFDEHELGSIRQVLLWFRQERIELPAQVTDENGRTIFWRAPVYNTVKHILTNPIYSGAYVHGRTNSRTRIENGRKQVARGMPRPRADSDVLLVDHHEGYINWEKYLHNQTVISGNATMHGQMVRGPARRGTALLTGLIRCGVCGRKLRVGYGGPQGQVARYQCVGASNHGIGAACLAFGSIRVDAAVEQEVLRVLAAVGVTAALEAIEVDRCNNNERCRQRELALEAARYEAERARQQYNAVDPTNRLVAADLERRWNERACVERLEAELASAKASVPTALGPAERAALQALGADLPRAWRHPAATPDHKKRIVRTVVLEIVVKPNPETLELLIHWQGGDHTAVTVPRNRTGHHRHATDTETADIIMALARHLPDSAIVAMLNRLGRRTGHGLTWTEGRLRVWRSDHHVKVYRDGERAQRGELLVQEVAVRLGVAKTNVIRMIKSGILPASQVCPGAPYVISEAALADPSRIAAIGRGPEPQDPNQLPLQLQ